MVEITKRGTFSYLSSLASFSPCSREMGLWPLAFKSVIVFSSFLKSTCNRILFYGIFSGLQISARPSRRKTTGWNFFFAMHAFSSHLSANQHNGTSGGMMPNLKSLNGEDNAMVLVNTVIELVNTPRESILPWRFRSCLACWQKSTPRRCPGRLEIVFFANTAEMKKHIKEIFACAKWKNNLFAYRSRIGKWSQSVIFFLERCCSIIKQQTKKQEETIQPPAQLYPQGSGWLAV